MIEITRALAEKLYNQGQMILILPCRMNAKKAPATSWYTKPKDDESATFKKLCEIIFFYNCNSKNGEKLKFYTKGEEE